MRSKTVIQDPLLHDLIFKRQGVTDKNGGGGGDSGAHNTALPVTHTQAALDVANEREMGYTAANAASNAKQAGQAYSANIDMGMGISPSPYGTTHPDYEQTEDAKEKKKNAINPNTHIHTRKTPDGFKEVAIKMNRGNAYMLRGKINGHSVNFLLDTGATSVAIPQQVANSIGLSGNGRGHKVQTANGETEMFPTELDMLEIGELSVRFCPAIINPSDKGDVILLGMSALKHFEIIQKNGVMILRGK